MTEKTTVGDIPVKCLTGASAAIWSGWRALGGRELVREASAKGTHIKLAYECLSHKKNCSIEEAEQYFNKEVEIWITELLNKRQIYRASHILKNMNRDPVEYIFEVCIKCKDPVLRNYLSEYLINVGHFKDEHIDSWNIMKSIVQFEQKYMIQDGLGSSICIEDILNLSDTVKQALCTELYFSMNEQNIVSKNITNIMLWDYLLSNNKIGMVKCWIDVYYNGNAIEESTEINEKYKSLFATLDITSDMLESIDSSHASTLVKDLTKNHLCRYGIFTTKEQQDIKLMLARIFSSAMTLEEFNAVLTRETCNINRTEFLQNIDKELCLAHCLSETDTREERAKVGELFDALTKMCESQDQDMLIEGIYKTISYLSDDVNEFLKQNYLIVLALLFSYLSKENTMNGEKKDSEVKANTLKDIFTSGKDLHIGPYSIPNEVLENTLKQVPILQHVIENNPKKEATMYELLDGYKGLNVKQLFKWRFENEPMPNFSNEMLIKKYGYTEALTYEYYLREARPSMAIFTLKQSQGKAVGSVSSRRKCRVSLYAHVLALRNLDKPEIVCSCISFIEMLGTDSENLRLHVTAANYILNEMDTPIGNLLENVIYKNDNDLKTVMSYFESSFQTNFYEHLIRDNERFIDALKIWDIIIRFARAHNFPLPDSLLKFLAEHNNWFNFVLVCDIFAYPLDQVLENATYFEDTVMREHLLTCLNNTQLSRSQSGIFSDQKIKSRDVRQSLYYKIGVKQNSSPISGSPTSIDTSTSDSCASVSEYPINDRDCSLDDDLWLIILKCHQSPDPPGALINVSRLTSRPFLTVLATCYEPSSTAAYCYSWIVISSADETIISDHKDCLEHQVWTANKVYNLLDTMTTGGYVDTLSRAYKIFMPDSPFNSFFEFLVQSVNRADFKGCQKYLQEFKTQCLSLKSNKAMDWDCSDTTYSQNLYWIGIVAIKCIIKTLAYNLKSTHLQIKFLNVLIRSNFHTDFPGHVPNFQLLLQVMQILQKTTITYNIAAFTVSDNVYNFDTEIERCINDLLSIENYNSALELSNAANRNSSDIILAQYRNMFKCNKQKNEIDNDFWRECASNFEKYSVPHEKATEFFVEHAEKVNSHKDRYEILKLAFEALKNVETEQETIDTLEMAMWKSCILAGPENIQLNNQSFLFNKLKTELLSGLNKLKFGYTLDDLQEREAAEELINKLIDLGRLDIALRISTIFNYKHKDLQILMLCLSLAEGEVSPNELSVEQKIILNEANKNKQQKYSALKNRGLRRLSSSSSLNALSATDETSRLKKETEFKLQMECLSILQKLLETLKHGVDVCQKIVLCYKLAVQLGKSYQVLLMLNHPMQFLQEIAEGSIEDKSEVISDVIAAYKISNDSVAAFLAENITMAITRVVEEGHEDNICLWGYPLNTNFRTIMELCNDVSLLGWQLLKTATKLLGHSQSDQRNVATLKTIVELLIRSHDCFTASCNMEGIASVLRKCQSLSSVLQSLKYWTLLVRLVTGVGRFTEMSYVFKILKETDQFEFLLGKGLDKVTGLKTALLEFLKRHCPENKDLFTLVALHFRLYHEIALMWETEAKEVIKALTSEATKDHGKYQSTAQHEMKLTKNEKIQKQLQLAVTNFTHAMQYYLQDNKLILASRCSDQSQLVALQNSLLNTVSNNQQVNCILNLKPDEVDRILSNVLSFPQALIVICAYNHHADWANLIYNHCILNGETKYLKDFLTVNTLTSSLVQDCARRYRLEKSITHTMTENMKLLITELTDVECKYVLASQLGFKNIVEAMLNNSVIGAYLKDTVWKRGYNAI